MNKINEASLTNYHSGSLPWWVIGTLFLAFVAALAFSQIRDARAREKDELRAFQMRTNGAAIVIGREK